MGSPITSASTSLREAGRDISFLGGHVLGYTNNQQLQRLVTRLCERFGLSKVNRHGISHPNTLRFTVDCDGALPLVNIISLAHVRRGFWSNLAARRDQDVVKVGPGREE